MPTNKLILNAVAQTEVTYYLADDQIWIFSIWMGITSPNAQLVSAAFTWMIEAGLYGFWDKRRLSFKVRPQMSFYAPSDPAHWERFTQELQDERDRGNLPTFGNSLLRSAFYLYLAGLALAIISIIFEFTRHSMK